MNITKVRFFLLLLLFDFNSAVKYSRNRQIISTCLNVYSDMIMYDIWCQRLFPMLVLSYRNVASDLPWNQQKVFLLGTCQSTASPAQPSHTEPKSPSPPLTSSYSALKWVVGGPSRDHRLSGAKLSLLSQEHAQGHYKNVFMLELGR